MTKRTKIVPCTMEHTTPCYGGAHVRDMAPPPAVRTVTYHFPGDTNKRTGRPVNRHYHLCQACYERFGTDGRVGDRAI